MARSNDEIPGSVRVRTDDGNEWRYDAIESAAAFYDRNRSDAIAFACEDVTGAVAFVESVLERDDLTVAQRQEIATLANQHLRGVSIDVIDEIAVSSSD